MPSSAIVLSIFVLFLALNNGSNAALTSEQESLRQEAIQQATDLIGDTARSATTDPFNFFDFVASRIEFSLNKQAASQRWADTEAPPVSTATASPFSRSFIVKSRSLKSVDCSHSDAQESELSTDGRGLLASSTCKTYTNINYIGAQLNFKQSITKSSDCCAYCKSTKGCVAWSLNLSSKMPKSKRGCYLKTKGYTTKKNVKGVISGTVTASRDITLSPPPPYYEPPSYEPVPYPEVPPPVPDPSSPSYGSPPGDGPPAYLPPPSYEPSPPPPAYYYSPPPPDDIPIYGDKETYAKVLGYSWRFYEAQRSGPTPKDNLVKWRSDSHMSDPVVGGWYDAGDFLKLNFPLAPSVGLLAWGMLDFGSAYSDTGTDGMAMENLLIAANYLLNSHDTSANTYVGQIGDPNIDHAYWGRPEDEKNARPAYVYKPSMAASDLYGSVSAALAATSIVLQKAGNNALATKMMSSATTLYTWGKANEGKYSDFYKKQTYSIYPSTDWADNMAWAAGWMYRATKDTSYLNDAISFFGKEKPDVFPCWDSLWATHAVHMVTLADQGVQVPGIATYRSFVEDKFLRSWLVADGYNDVVTTPKGLHYPKWNEWANLQFSTTVAALALHYAQYTTDSSLKSDAIKFAQKQVDYALGNGSLRSYVVGFGPNPPSHQQHAAASCPNEPAPCGWKQFSSPNPNPQVLYGGLVGGPAGERKNAANPDDSYQDKRSDYVTNEVANDYNAGFTNALAGLYVLLS